MVKLKILELFSGTESFSKVARERGHETFTVDNDKRFNPDLCIDVMDLTSEMISFKPDIIWSSPPCQCFSIASVYRHWKQGKPISQGALNSIELIKKLLTLLKELNPQFFIIENPRGMLRKMVFMQDLHRDTITYCQYGFEYQKATDLWNNLNYKFKPMCSPKSPCHVRSPRGSKTGIQGRKGNHPDWNYSVNRSAVIRSVVPKELCLDIIKHCEIEIKRKNLNKISEGINKSKSSNIENTKQQNEV